MAFPQHNPLKKTSPNLSSLFLIVIMSQICPSFTNTVMDIFLRRSFLLLQGVSGPLKAAPTHNLSKYHYLIRRCYPTNHHSSQEYASYKACCLLLPFLNPTTCSLSNPRSTSLILSLSLLLVFRFLLSSFVRAFYRTPLPFPYIIC